MAKKQQPLRGPQLELAGDLAVAFVNTGAARDKNRQVAVENYDQLLTWSQQVGVVQPSEAEVLSREAIEHPGAAQTVFERADMARSSLARLFVAWQLGEALPEADLATVNDALSQGISATRLVPAETGLTWGWIGDPKALDRMLWPILHKAAELLISTEGRPEVRQCALHGCGLFFVDRIGQRRWCDMKTCGNRAKSLRYYRTRGREERRSTRRKLGLKVGNRPRPSLLKI